MTLDITIDRISLDLPSIVLHRRAALDDFLTISRGARPAVACLSNALKRRYRPPGFGRQVQHAVPKGSFGRHAPESGPIMFTSSFVGHDQANLPVSHKARKARGPRGHAGKNKCAASRTLC
jgi:hypothetical protein